MHQRVAVQARSVGRFGINSRRAGAPRSKYSASPSRRSLVERGGSLHYTICNLHTTARVHHDTPSESPQIRAVTMYRYSRD